MSSWASEQTFDPPISHALSHSERVILVPDEVSPETSRHFAEEFGAWIVGNGLRELIETLSIFLTRLHTASALIARRIEIVKEEARFEMKSIREQLAAVCELLGVVNSYTSIVESWRKARTCLAHRLGVVAQTDGDENANVLTVRWRGLQLRAVEPDGKVTVLNLNTAGNPYFEHGASIEISVLGKSVEFELGQPIRLTGHQLSEICWTAQELSRDLIANSEAATKKLVSR
jgi:hypothetical protein